MTAYEFALSLENGLHNEIEDLLEKHSQPTNHIWGEIGFNPILFG